VWRPSLSKPSAFASRVPAKDTTCTGGQRTIMKPYLQAWLPDQEHVLTDYRRHSAQLHVQNIQNMYSILSFCIPFIPLMYGVMACMHAGDTIQYKWAAEPQEKYPELPFQSLPSLCLPHTLSFSHSISLFSSLSLPLFLSHLFFSVSLFLCLCFSPAISFCSSYTCDKGII
jgi:hypothetical protein